MATNETLPLPSVREILGLPEVVAGDPVLLAGSDGLDTQLRWVHVAAGEGLAKLLDGGELILTTGAGWPENPASLVSELIDAGIAAVAIELGGRYQRVPEEIVATFERRGVPLIAFRREARFVQITERVHRRILAAQSEALEARATVHEMLTELGLNRSPVDYVIEQLAVTVDAPVVLENAGGQVVAWASPHAGMDATSVLAHWPVDPSDLPRATQEWNRVPVEARGTRWGTLTALPGPAHPAGRQTVLELGAFALALGRLADPDRDDWLQLGSAKLVDTLLSGRFRREEDLGHQLSAAGLPVEGRVLFGASLRGVGSFGSHSTLEWALLETALRRAVAPEGRVIIASGTDQSDEHTLLAMISVDPADPRGRPVTGSSGEFPALAIRLDRELRGILPDTVPGNWRAHLAIGAPGYGPSGLVTSLEGVRAAGRLSTPMGTDRVAVQQATAQPLEHLVRSLAGVPAVSEFARETLAPLVEHDRRRDGDLLRVLGSVLEHPTNRSAAAQAANLSRSVFYQRIALIEELLGQDLSNGTTIATLRVALLAHQSR
ncbi:PucR family transcriptional regulator [Leucobacter sp. M11]|uniref:PucR family transcriptional regulator n=1 Tax=Leucobacter sp. M11 TaxID=2993565 RepID=UPI002D7EE4AC|nr:PucR family transcriptional regulator [Leucobacter sp. M11]MEB4615363.1 PucR family transcriptional regulator [Leucobacter sp. M11]